jgi:cold shock CspA family protein
MQVPMEVAFKGVQKSEALEQLIESRAARLDKVCPNIISCRITLEKAQETNAIYSVRIIVRTPPEHEIVARRESPERGVHEDALQILVRETFDAVEKQLKQFAQKRRREVKAHPEQQPTAVVVRLFREEGYGFLMSLDGREIYFHKNSVTNSGFDRLEIGTGVRFEEAEGDEGPQASTVQIEDKPGAHVQDEEHVDVPLGWRARG